MSDKLPSLDDFTESELPSVEQFLKEEETVELPSVEEFVEEEVEEDSITIEDANGDPFLENACCNTVNNTLEYFTNITHSPFPQNYENLTKGLNL